MKLTVLVDDNVSKSRRLLTEHGLCFYIEADGKKILFDLGYSDVFIKNAMSLGINLLDLDYIVLSHGHYDHTWGLAHYLAFYMSALEQKQKVKKPTIITHPYTFFEKYEEGFGEIGCILTEEKLKKSFEVISTIEPYKITESLTFLGEVPRINTFEGKIPVDKFLIGGEYQDDYILEDSALVYEAKEGLSIITGCSHSGICNIVEHAKTICKNGSINSIIGGFHLIEESEEKMDKIIDYLRRQKVKTLCPCHCTDFDSRRKLAEALSITDVGVGFSLRL